jgi:pimeloyl-ACP methyl ester carboxylesterase
METRRLTLWQGKVTTDVDISGSGPPIVYFHGPWGLPPDRSFVARLAETHTVYAPKHPGTSEGAPDDAHAIDNFWDLVIYYTELLDRLELDRPVLVGHSFGGLVAAEIAATDPTRARRLVLISPVGLWRDEQPVRNWMVLPVDERPRTLFADPESAAARGFFAVPADAGGRIDRLVAMIWAQATTGKFIWPVPDRGLKKHIHRIAAPTLVIWGDADRIIAPSYADDFASKIAHARAALVKGAGHLPQIEKIDMVVELIEEFLK